MLAESAIVNSIPSTTSIANPLIGILIFAVEPFHFFRRTFGSEVDPGFGVKV
jgi:hypothetical protein